MAIARVQGNFRGTTTGSSIGPISLANYPTNGNVLIAVINSSKVSGPGSYVTVSGISQTNVNWTTSGAGKQHGNQYNDGASKDLTVTLSGGPATEGAACDVCEYSGLATSGFLDKTKPNSGQGSIPSTGTTDPTTSANELWIGGIVSYETVRTSATNSFTLLDGAQISGPQYWTGLSYLERIVYATEQANSSVNNSNYWGWVGCIATFKESLPPPPPSGTIVVLKDERYSGNGSKQSTVTYSGDSVIMQVLSNAADENSSAIIENLIIDGQDQANTIGIQLQNVSNCIIRNVTIMNCNIGIHLWITGSNSMKGNRFEHIRMINVKHGIFFEGNSSYNDFSFTTIDNVGISLPDQYFPNGIGIEVGEPYATLNNAFIKATVWLRSSNGIAMQVNGQIKYSLVNLEVEDAGTGVQITATGTVNDNQSFLL